MPSVPTWDDMALASWDELWTWDDPLRNAVINAIYASGELNIDSASVVLDWVGGPADENLVPSVLARHEFTNTTPIGLSPTPIEGYAWTTEVDGSVSESGGAAVFKPAVLGSIYVATLTGAPPEVDFDVTVRVSATQLATGARVRAFTYARRTDASNHLRASMEFNPDRVIGWSIVSNVGGVATTLSSGNFWDLYHVAAQWYYFRFQGIGNALRVKAWVDSSTTVQPDEWDGTATDVDWYVTPGYAGMGASASAGNTNTLPYNAILFDRFFLGANRRVDSAAISVGASLDDGMPSAATNTSNIGVNEASSGLLAPIGTRPDLYFGTYRTDQPFADLPRDTAGVVINSQIVASDGIRPVRIFSGQMTDIPLDGQSAKITAVSRNRLRLSTQVRPPAVHGFYEGGEATWLVAYALFKSGLYVAPRPLSGCRLYVPFNGTTHPYIPDTNAGAAPIGGIRYRGYTSVFQRPDWIDGPFTAAPDLAAISGKTQKVIAGPGTIAYAPGNDFLSKTNATGRIELWIKGDWFNFASSAEPSSGQAFTYRLRNTGNTRYIWAVVGADRRVSLTINDGTNNVFYDGGFLPNDGLWHFIGFSWNITSSGGGAKVRLDDKTTSYGSAQNWSGLPGADDVTVTDFACFLPLVELRVSAWIGSNSTPFANEAPFTSDVIMRRSSIAFEAIAEKDFREAFELISAVAQAELARTGFTEDDAFRYLPLPYWAEPEQQITRETLSTASNLGEKFRPIRDVTKVYNQITLGYKSTSVQEIFTTVFQSSQLVSIGGVQTLDLFCVLTNPVVEMRGLTLAVMSGAALAAAPPTDTNAINYITLNTAIDGSGTYATASDVEVTIPYWDPGQAMVRIRNKTGQTWYISNNVSLAPIGLSAKVVMIQDASVQYQVPESIMVRGTRNLDETLPMLQTRDGALSVARSLAGFLAYPRTTFVSDAFPDPRRQPGMLVAAVDTDGSGLDGTFRLTGITTSQDGASFQQVIAAEEAWPVMIWGVSLWGKAIWGRAI